MVKKKKGRDADQDAISRIQERAQERMKKLRSGIFHKMDQGENVFRIVPLPIQQSEDYDEFAIERRKHHGFRDKEGNNIAPECLDFLRENKLLKKFFPGDENKKKRAKIIREGCPICQLVEAAREAGDDKIVDATQATTSFDIQIIPEGLGQYKLLGVGNKIYRALLALQKKRDYVFLVHPKKGRKVSVERTGTGKFDTRYNDPQPLLRKDPLPKNWKKKCIQINSKTGFFEASRPTILDYRRMMDVVEDNYPGMLGEIEEEEL